MEWFCIKQNSFPSFCFTTCKIYSRRMQILWRKIIFFSHMQKIEIRSAGVESQRCAKPGPKQWSDFASNKIRFYHFVSQLVKFVVGECKNLWRKEKTFLYLTCKKLNFRSGCVESQRCAKPGPRQWSDFASNKIRFHHFVSQLVKFVVAECKIYEEKKNILYFTCKNWI